MNILFIIIFIFTIIIITIIPHTESAGICRPFYCNRHQIRFPFRVARNQSKRCGYPRFDLACSSHGETFLHLRSNSTSPSSSSSYFKVQAIDYFDQILWASDPNGCLPKRILDLDLNLNLNFSSSPYRPGPDSAEYSFLNCSGRVDPDRLPAGSSAVGCMSGGGGGGFTVVVTSEEKAERELVGRKCEVVRRIVAPFWWRGLAYGLYPADMGRVLLQLSWDVPGCGDCVVRGGSCGFVNDSGLEVGCFFDDGGGGGIPRSAKYGLILGIGVPGLLFMTAFIFYLSIKVKAYMHTTGQSRANTESSSTITPQPIILTLGLDGPTIDSYPMIVLGESKRVPGLSDGTCPICLSEYQPKEALRAIPDCNHCFHAECIDEWLRMNATCPLCRKSPQKSSENGP